MHSLNRTVVYAVVAISCYVWGARGGRLAEEFFKVTKLYLQTETILMKGLKAANFKKNQSFTRGCSPRNIPGGSRSPGIAALVSDCAPYPPYSSALLLCQSVRTPGDN